MTSLNILGQQVTDNTQREIAQALSYMEPQVDVRVEYLDVPDRPDRKVIAHVLYSTTYIENWCSGVKRIIEACQKRGVAAPTWSINGGFVVVTFVRPTKGDTQDDTEDDIQGGTQDGTQSGTQEDSLDKWIENQIRENPQITTEELAKMSKKGLRTIKRHIAKMPHIHYVSSGYSGHWEVDVH